VAANVATLAVGGLFRKKSVPLIRPLLELPESYGERFVLAKEVDFGPKAKHIVGGKERLRPDTVDVLGTKDFVTWYYLDTSQTGPGGKCDTFVRLHVVYYTGLLDAVPHVADICMLAGGAQALGSRLVDWHVNDPPAEWRQWEDVKVRRSEFVKDRARTVVYYLFSVNGEPKNHRLDVRKALADPFQEYAYYAKIEVSAGRMSEREFTSAQQEEIARAFFAQATGAILRHLPSAETVAAMESGR